MSATTLAAALAERPVLLDGGLATRLEADGHNLSSALWSARLLLEQPAAVQAVHERFFAAGAEVATTASYQVSYAGLAAVGVDRAGTERLLRRSVELADRARRQVADGRPRWVAASVGPYGAARADGSEYHSRYGVGVDVLRAWHRPRLEVLAAAGADVLACETVPSTAEAEALVAELERLEMPGWLSLTVVGGEGGPRTRTGEPLAEVAALVRDVATVLAVGVNCCTPADASAAVPVLAASGKPVVVYPNSGEAWHAVARGWAGAPALEADAVRGWLANGARLVGGCCRVGLDGVAALGAVLAEGSAG